MDRERFAHIRPFLYHATSRENLAGIKAEAFLDPAAALMRRSGRADLLRWRRRQPIALHVGDHIAIVGDQIPLDPDTISLERGWAFEDFVEYLNEHVFFWPGTAEGPLKTGVHMPVGLEDEHTIMLRLPTADLFSVNEDEPRFCPVNVRAVRSEDARRSRRGSHLFAIAAEFGRRETDVVEVGYRSRVELPASTMIRDAGSWRLLRN